MTDASTARKAVQEKHGWDPNITGTAVGYKYVNGKRTDEISVVVFVKRKLPETVLPRSLKIAKQVDGVKTDVQVAQFRKLSATGAFEPAALTQRLRPCPAGYSLGHTAVTAGTLGAYVSRPGDSRVFILSNNHVMANENDAIPGDHILQPGPHDGGQSPTNRFATLVEYARIQFDGKDGEPPGAKKCAGVARAYALFVKSLFNVPAAMFGCSNRMKIVDTRVRARALEQPYPNLVDAAISVVNNPADVLREVAGFGPISGLGIPTLGLPVKKTGRTTEATLGRVDAIDGNVQVQYDQGVATFQNQVFIRSTTSQPFSAGGDSGSAILTEDNRLVGLLFAGGGNLTIANDIRDVQTLFNITV